LRAWVGLAPDPRLDHCVIQPLTILALMATATTTDTQKRKGLVGGTKAMLRDDNVLALTCIGIQLRDPVL
jgi:hypothetical protein